VKRTALFAWTLAAACMPQRVEVAPPSGPRLAATATARRVVFMTFDGLGADALASRTDVPTFSWMSANGFATRVFPVNPTATASTHVAMLTGAPPEKNGIIANRFHVRGTAADTVAKGLENPIAVETLLEAAKRQGKRVGAVPFPTVDSRDARRTADFGVIWPESKPGRVVHLTRSDFHREWVPPTWSSRPQRHPSFSPVMRARTKLPAPLTRDVDVVVYDSTDDGIEDYDKVRIEETDREIEPDATGWFPISTQTSAGLVGLWSKVVSIDGTLADVQIYWGPANRTNAYPESFRRMLDDEAGFWPANPDEQPDAGAQIFIEQSERLAAFLAHVQQLAIERMPFDLLLAYQSVIDSAGHNYLGREDVMARAYAAADRSLLAVAHALDLQQDALVVAGDHGLAHLDNEVHMNALLHDGGFTPRWRAYATGNVAHLYLFSGTDDSDAVIALLQSTKQFERVEKRSAGSAANSGDIVAYAFSNVALTESSDPPTIGRASKAGNHGALNTHRELHPALLAIGAGVPKAHIDSLPQTKIARFIAQLLGVEPPSSAE
jgi:predicted AlkP superfamily pyrophosphatase or phosphodiesterase